MRGFGVSAVVGLALALIGVLAAELRPSFTGDAEASPVPAAAQVRPAPPVPAPSVRRDVPTAALLARPLFTPGRRVAAAPPPAAAVPVSLPRLAGVVIHGSDRSVILVPVDGGKAVVAHEGTQIGGYTVQAIQAGDVTMLGPDGVRVLRPTFDPRARAVGTPALPPGGSAQAPGPALLNRQGLQGLPGFPGLPGTPQASSAR